VVSSALTTHVRCHVFYSSYKAEKEIGFVASFLDKGYLRNEKNEKSYTY